MGDMTENNISASEQKSAPFYKKTFIRAIFVFALIFASFGAGFWTSQTYFPKKIVYTGITNQDKGEATKYDFGIFWDAWEVIETKYAERQNLDYPSMVMGAIEGMVKSLGDPYSIFLNSTTSKQFKESIQGSFEGIGAELDIKNGLPIIVAPLKDSPAEKAGLQSEDQILKVNGEEIEGLTLDEVVSKIRGPKGTNVTLTILRKNSENPFDITIKRATIRIPVASYELRDGVNYVQIYQFSETLPTEFNKIVEKILNSGSDKIIIDLRNNPGGYLETAVDVASYFIPKGQTVVIEDFGGDKQDFFNSYGYDLLNSYKAVVLVNGGSASASEILAGALRDQKSIKLVGTKTFGKGSVQELENLREGTSIKITVAHWLTPNKNQISGKGLEPDITVELTEQDRQENKDTQLEKALETVKSL